MAYKQAQLIAIQSLKTWLGEDKLKELINFLLHYIADLDIPIKRGTFIEFRNGMMNVCPIGRNCSQAERDEFEKFDHGAGVRSCSFHFGWSQHLLLSIVSGNSGREHCIIFSLLSTTGTAHSRDQHLQSASRPLTVVCRKKFVETLKHKFSHLGLTYSIGGQISFDVFPQGWDKTYCLQYIENDFDEIHFFGDKTYEVCRIRVSSIVLCVVTF